MKVRLIRSLTAFGLALAALVSPLVAHAAEGPTVQAPHMELQLVSAGAAVPGATVQVALRMKPDKDWHSFWRNPGDAGEPTRLAWTLPAGWSNGEFTWPLPKTLLVGGILMNYVYDGEVLLAQPLKAPADARPGQTIKLKAEAVYQVCSDTCVPGQETLTLDLPVAAAPSADAKWGPAIDKTLTAAPRPAPGLIAVFETGPTLRLAVAGAPLKGADFKDARFFPFDNNAIDNAKPQGGSFGAEGVTLTLPKSAEAKGDIARLAGVIAVDGKGYEIAAAPGALPPGASGKGSIGQVAKTAGDNLNIWTAVLSALLGGLILNLMPCVFPVLSMKAASFAGHAHAANVRTQGLSFLAGVIVAFMALALALLAAKAAGSAAGWGFQLQSPPVIAALCLLMLLIALNFAGLFEIGTSVQGLGGNLADQGGVAGSFFTGALAVVVAAPCTAPFMAGALGFALAQPAVVSLLVFLALAVGFAAPFTALTFAPGLLKLIPRPGGWMNIFKTVLAFPMLGAAGWLAWVFTSQVGVQGLPFLFAAAILTALGAWLFGIGQTRINLRPRVILQIMLPLALLGSGYLIAKSQRAEATAEPWSVNRVTELRARQVPILVNFTAAWCVTCQVNEGAALSSPEVAEVIARTKTVYLKGDWTKPDSAIAAALAEHGRAGVPLYLVYPAGGGEPEVLPQILTPGIVKAALEKAAGK